MKKQQQGFSLSGLIYWGIALSVLFLLGAKIIPTIVEYQKTVSAIKKTSENVASNASIPEVRRAYAKIAVIDSLELRPDELDIQSNQGDRVVISFAYDKKIPLVGPASLLIEYRGSTARK